MLYKYCKSKSSLSKEFPTSVLWQVTLPETEGLLLSVSKGNTASTEHTHTDDSAKQK